MTAQTVSNAVEKKQDSPVQVMWSRRSHFNAVLPQSVDVEAFLGTAAGALYANRDLMDAAVSNPDSLITVLMRCAALGHLPGTDEFYLYNRKRKGRPEVAGTEGYRGIIERMYRSGAVAKVVVREVCANDKFRYIEGIDDKPVHEIGGTGGSGADFFAKRDRGGMVGVYAYAELTTGAVSRVVLLTADDVMAAKAASDAGESSFSPWSRLDGGKDHPEFTGRSMWWKTGARRLEPWVPTSREYRASMLSASAKAAELAAPRPAAALPPSGGAIVDAELVDDTPDASPAQAASPVAAEPPPPAGAGEAQREPALITSGQKTQIERQFARLGIDPDTGDGYADMLTACARLAGLAALAALGELTQGEAADIIGAVKKLPGGGARQLADLTGDGVKPGAQEEAGGDE